MSSADFEEFAENFGGWMTDHGAGGRNIVGSAGEMWSTDIHLPTLEAGIKDLILEARALVAAETLIALDNAVKSVVSDRITLAVMTRTLEPVRSELAEIADPGGQCAACGHVAQPEYRHGTASHLDGDLRARVRHLESLLGVRT